jgi:hypothetical protein
MALGQRMTDQRIGLAILLSDDMHDSSSDAVNGLGWAVQSGVQDAQRIIR